MDNEPQQLSSIYFVCLRFEIVPLVKEGLLGIILLRCLIIAAVPNKNWLKIIFIKKVIHYNFELHKNKVAQNYEKALSLVNVEAHGNNKLRFTDEKMPIQGSCAFIIIKYEED
ncbi:hypothetical protein T4A_12031 [Trichinella pseudospiralis]|uniref:Uncharacterized protein n=1 Tax=Trichinella pseudospiralis TaxID=6337 RepID=A0A0V1DVV1_TRIPS|nr:hypothetical protein T4A_12031 [Trichinella pseudospiralis]